MRLERSPFQGVANIVRFNWPFFMFAALAIFVCAVVFVLTGHWALIVLAECVLLTIFISLAVSFWVYDYSGIYDLEFLNQNMLEDCEVMVNLTAGFDECSERLRQKAPRASLRVFDFYNADVHTEASVRRAREAYPLDPVTEKVTTNELPLGDGEADFILAFFAIHEIRDFDERVCFFKELKRGLGRNGKLYVVEHSRDLPNFLAYTFGAFHFLSKREIIRTFSAAGFQVECAQKHTPFVTIYTLN